MNQNIYHYQNVKIKHSHSKSLDSFFVIADSERFGIGEIVCQGHDMDTCLRFLLENGLSIKDVTNVHAMPDVSLVEEEIKDTVEGAYKAIYDRCNIILPPIRFEFDEPYCKSIRCAGVYMGMDKDGVHNIKLRYPDGEEAYDNISTAVHEIGHALHEQYFHNESFYLGSDGKSNYAKKNGHENFAVGFAKFIMGGINCDRSVKVAKILSGIAIEPISMEPTPFYQKKMKSREKQVSTPSKHKSQMVK